MVRSHQLAQQFAAEAVVVGSDERVNASAYPSAASLFSEAIRRRGRIGGDTGVTQRHANAAQ